MGSAARSRWAPFPRSCPRSARRPDWRDWQIGLVAGLLGFARMAADVPVGLVITHHLRRTLTVAPFVLALGAIWSGRWRIVRAARARPRADGRRPRAHRGERPHRAAALRAGGRDGAGPHRVRDVGDDRGARRHGVLEALAVLAALERRPADRVLASAADVRGPAPTLDGDSTRSGDRRPPDLCGEEGRHIDPHP